VARIEEDSRVLCAVNLSDAPALLAVPRLADGVVLLAEPGAGLEHGELTLPAFGVAFVSLRSP